LKPRLWQQSSRAPASLMRRQIARRGFKDEADGARSPAKRQQQPRPPPQPFPSCALQGLHEPCKEARQQLLLHAAPSRLSTAALSGGGGSGSRGAGSGSGGGAGTSRAGNSPRPRVNLGGAASASTHNVGGAFQAGAQFAPPVTPLRCKRRW